MIPGLEQLFLDCAPQVSPVTLRAIVRVESGGNPWALHVNDPQRNKGAPRLPGQPGSKAEAIRWAETLIAAGHSVDLGLMQVNSGNLRRLQLTAAQVLDPCTNVAAGARILSAFYSGAAGRMGEGQPALRAALSAYNTGNHWGGFRNGYVGKVVANAGQQHARPRAPAATAAEWSQPLVYYVSKPGH